MVNETLREISEKVKANEAKLDNHEKAAEVLQENDAKFEEKLSKMDQKIDYLATNFDLMRKNYETLLKSNQNNEILDFLKMEAKNRETFVKNFNSKFVQIEEKLEKIEEKTANGGVIV